MSSKNKVVIQEDDDVLSKLRGNYKIGLDDEEDDGNSFFDEPDNNQNDETPGQGQLEIGQVNELQRDRSKLMTPNVGQRNFKREQRSNHIDNPGVVLHKILETSGIEDYTVEQVVSMADPQEYKQELSAVVQSLDLQNERDECED